MSPRSRSLTHSKIIKGKKEFVKDYFEMSRDFDFESQVVKSALRKYTGAR